MKSPIYGKQIGQTGTVGSKIWPTEQSYTWLTNDKGMDFSKLRLYKIKWQHSEILQAVQFVLKQPSYDYEMTSPKVGHEYWQNGEYTFPEGSKPVRYINVKADDDFIYSMVFLDGDKKVFFEL